MSIKDTIKKWDYVQYNIITRIPNAVGRSWEEGYNIRLEKKECCEAPSNFDGCHMGNGSGFTKLLAKDENGNYLLLNNK